MAELLVQASNPTRQAGEVIAVREDGFGWSDLERRQFLVVSVPLSVAEAEERWRQSGTPAELLAAVDAADAAVVAARTTGGDVQAAEAALAAAHAATQTGWPARARRLNLAALPAASRSAVQDTWDALAAVAVEAKAAEEAAGHASLEARLGRSLTVEERALSTSQASKRLAQTWRDAKAAGATDQELGHIDEARDALHAASRTGRASVEAPALAGLPIPVKVTLSRAALTAATVEALP